MDFNELILSKENTVLAYVVFKEHTIGYLFCLNGMLYLGVISGKITKGGLNWKNGNYMISSSEFKYVRKATIKDFHYFKVSLPRHDLAL